ncbi:MAG: hypothetical protein IID45_13470, partial [Planctomycetes bacterium]|nr:hypothetical protein [Planctomycetota bacterium]
MCCLRFSRLNCVLFVVCFCSAPLAADEAKSRASKAPSFDTSRGDRMITRYFLDETRKLESASLAAVKTK